MTDIEQIVSDAINDAIEEHYGTGTNDDTDREQALLDVIANETPLDRETFAGEPEPFLSEVVAHYLTGFSANDDTDRLEAAADLADTDLGDMEIDMHGS